MGDSMVFSADGPEGLSKAICEITQHVMAKVAERTHNDGQHITHMGAMATLGALIPTALAFAAKQADLSKENIEKNGKEIVAGALTPETLLFAALVAVSQVIGFNKPEHGLETTYGPEVLGAAVEKWEKIFPDKDITKFVDPHVVGFGREAQFTKQFQKGFVLPNNGTVN